MTNSKTAEELQELSPAAAQNVARLKASGISLSNDYGRWALHLAQTSKLYLCLAKKDFDYVCIQPGDGAGHRCALHGGASRGPKTQEGRARSIDNLRQNTPRAAAPSRAIEEVARSDDGAVLGEFLNRDELFALTGRKQPAAQCRELREMGIPFIRRGSGAPVVSRVLVQQAMSPRGGSA